MRRSVAAAGVAGALALAIGLAGIGGAAGSTVANWTSYMFDAKHGSTNAAATAITPANAAGLVQAWNWVPDPPTQTGQPANDLFASPTVYNGTIFIGANTGDFYALDEATGNVLWKKFIGFVPAKTLGARGITATAAVATDPSNGKTRVYVAGGDGYLYAFDAATGNQVWRSVVAIPSSTKSDFYNWGSPVVAGGHVYYPISSQGDHPLVQGGLKMYDQTTGSLQATYHTVPDGHVGGSIWSSPTATFTGSDVWVTTGNPSTKDAPNQWDGNSFVRLDGSTLKKIDRWRVPVPEQQDDSDFGGSPTLFLANLGGTVTGMIGACNKNGKYYALKRGHLSDGPVWSFQVGVPDEVGPGLCVAGAVWDGSRLFVAGNGTTINGTTYEGSIRELDPATGTPVWQTGLAGNVLGTPTEDGAGVLAVGSWDYNTGAQKRVWLVDASSGQILNTINVQSAIFAQPVFADGFLLVPSQKHGLFAFRPAS